MLILQGAKSATSRQGCRRMSLSQLRDGLVCPSALGTDSRQRLWELSQRLSRIRALGDEYARVAFSDSAMSALRGRTESS